MAESADASSARSQPRPGVWIGATAAVGLLCIALISPAIQERTASRIPTDDEWKSAGEHVTNHALEGDVVRFAPRWDDRARLHIADLDLDLVSVPERDRLNRYKRLWLVSGVDQHEAAKEELSELYPHLSSAEFGNVFVDQFELPNSPPRFDFVESLRTAKVTVRETAAPPYHCSAWKGDAYLCPKYGKWIKTARRTKAIHNEPRTCVYLPPPPGNAWMEATWNVELAGELRGGIGLTNRSWRAKRGGDSEVEVLIDEKPVHTVLLESDDREFHRFEIDTSALAGSTRKVTFRSRSTDPLDRFVCFTAIVPASP